MLSLCLKKPLCSHLTDGRDLRSSMATGVHQQTAVFARLHARQRVDPTYDRIGLAEEKYHVKGTATISTAVLCLDVKKPIALTLSRAGVPALGGTPLHHADKSRVEVRMHCRLAPCLYLLHQPGKHFHQVVLPRAGVNLLQEPRDFGPGKLAEGTEFDCHPTGADDANLAGAFCRKSLQQVLRLGAKLMAFKTIGAGMNQ
mmetsp:Transcript_94568/g.276366  ORF Transcript_94568/g.276366 Transcript_94568/m.276366 type:complete len:200 (-) Transcript_94568:994-1593(-)